MAANETIDKLKSAGYITVTADSQGIADQCQIGGGSSEIDEYLEENNIQYEIVDNHLYGVFNADDSSVYWIEEGSDVYFSTSKSVFSDNAVYFHKDIEYTYTDEEITYKLVVKNDFRQTISYEMDLVVPSSYFDITPPLEPTEE